MVSCVVSNHSHDSVFLCCSSTDSQGFNAIIILTTQGPFPRIIHGARSTRGPRSKARLPNVAYGADDKICSRFHIFAHRSLVFDLVTRRDLAHQEWSIVERDSACLALEKHKQRWSPFFFFFFFLILPCGRGKLFPVFCFQLPWRLNLCLPAKLGARGFRTVQNSRCLALARLPRRSRKMSTSKQGFQLSKPPDNNGLVP